MASSCLLPINDSDSDHMNDQNNMDTISKPTNCLKLIGSNVMAFGLELCSSAGFTYITPILLKDGFSDKALTFILSVGPFISLILVPMIGGWSDKCQSRYGRRRPFMFVLGITTVVSLLIIPYSHEIFSYDSFIGPSCGLAIGVILFDFSSQALMNPCKALISDIFYSMKEQNSGFTIYSCMLSLGGCVGYFITSLNWTTTSIGNFFGGQEKAVFSILAILLLILLIINLSIAKEKPLVRTQILCTNLDNNSNDFTLKQDEHFAYSFNNSKTQNDFNGGIKINNVESYEAYKVMFGNPVKKGSYILKTKIKVKTFIYSIELQIKIFFQYVFNEYIAMPLVLYHLFIACLFGWMGVMCHDMYYTDFVGQVIYKGRPHADSFAVLRYDKGIRMGSVGLLLHCLSAAIYVAFLQEHLISRFGTYRIYLLGIIYFSMSMLGTAMTSSIILVNLFCAISGIGYAVLTTIPYSLITEYYNKKEKYYKNNNIRGVGKDMAVLDVAYFLSQIIPSLFLGVVVEYTKSSSTYMMIAAICGGAASYFTYFVTFPS